MDPWLNPIQIMEAQKNSSPPRKKKMGSFCFWNAKGHHHDWLRSKKQDHKWWCTKVTCWTDWNKYYWKRPNSAVLIIFGSSNYYLFPNLKTYLAEQKYPVKSERHSSCRHLFCRTQQIGSRDKIRKLENHWNKCIVLQSN